MKRSNIVYFLILLIILMGFLMLIAGCTATKFPICHENKFDNECELVADETYTYQNDNNETVTYQHVHCESHNTCAEIYKRKGKHISSTKVNYHKYQ